MLVLRAISEKAYRSLYFHSEGIFLGLPQVLSSVISSHLEVSSSLCSGSPVSSQLEDSLQRVFQVEFLVLLIYAKADHWFFSFLLELLPA